MKSLLRAVNAGLGAALVLLGAGLAFAPFIDTGHAAATDSFLLIQFHCVLTGALALLPVFWARRDIFTAAPALLALGVNGWLGVLVVTSGDPRLLWALALAASSAACLAYLFATDAPVEGAASGAGPDEEAGLVAPDFGAGRAQSRGRAVIFSVGLIVVALAAVSVLLFFGGVYCELLKLALIERRAINLAAVFKTLAGGAGADFLFRSGLTLGATALVYGLLFVVEAAIAAGAEKRLRNASADFDRDFSRSERIYLRDSLDALLRYLAERDFGRVWPALYAIGVTVLIVMMVAGPLLVVLGETLAMAALERERAGDADALFYSDPFYIGGGTGGFFAGTLAIWSLFQVIGRRHPDFGVYLYVRTGWNSLSNGPRSADQYLVALTRFLRAHRLVPDAPFDPGAFLRAAFREHERIVHAATAWALLATAIGAIADVARFRLVDEDGVTYSNYFQFARKRVALADIDHVKLECALLAPDDDGDIGFRISYIIVEKDAFQVDLIHRWKKDPELLDRLLGFDDRLKAAGVPAVRTESIGWGRLRRPGFIDDCAKEIRARYDAGLAPSLIRLLGADTAAAPAP